jgi:hypothetical protein
MVSIKVSIEKLYQEFMTQLSLYPDPEQAFHQAISRLGWEYLVKVDQIILTGNPLESMLASGKFRDYVYVTRAGKTYIRKYVIPDNPRTAGQQEHRARFGEISKSWSILSPEQKQQYNLLASGQQKSGFNLYVEQQFQI